MLKENDIKFIKRQTKFLSVHSPFNINTQRVSRNSRSNVRRSPVILAEANPRAARACFSRFHF